ncbi:MAG: glycoside hydrolase family 3 N-terminal domain-containing protein [Bacteroidota bacterium]
MRIIISFLLLSLLYACSTPKTEEAPADNMLEDKIGQLLMVGFRGMELADSSHIIEDIKSRNLGGIVLFDYDVESKGGRNVESPEQLKKLVSDLQGLSDQKLIIAIDQENGLVNRLKAKYGFPDFNKSAQYLGSLNQLDTTQYWADSTAKSLRNLGINLNFAPVVDVNINPSSPAIGNKERSFSADPAIVAAQAAVVIDAHTRQGVLTSLKHFPGHGSAKSDSHAGFTDLSETWSEMELEPYKSLIDSKKAQMIMTAHVFNKQLDADLPATLSKAIIQDLLRGKLGWQGVVISDDMHMGAITENYGLEDAIEKSINAGVDILVFANNNGRFYQSNAVAKAKSIILKLIKEGKVSKERIDESYARIQALKEKI